MQGPRQLRIDAVECKRRAGAIANTKSIQGATVVTAESQQVYMPYQVYMFCFDILT